MNYRSKISEILCVIFTNFITLHSLLEMNSDVNNAQNSQLEVRAVLIKCEISGNPDLTLEGEATRFQREELFKHDALHNCKQKLAITVKTTSVPNQVSGDEYIPIEHVLGANKKKLRLLNPYVLRLRRKLPFQAYKLRKIDTVTGIIVKSPDKKRTAKYNESNHAHSLSRRSNYNENWFSTFDANTHYSKNNGPISYFTNYKTTPFMEDMDYYDDAHIYLNKNRSVVTKNRRVKREMKIYNDNFPQNSNDEFKTGYKNSPREPLFEFNKNLNYEHAEFNGHENKQEVEENDFNGFNKNGKTIKSPKLNKTREKEGKNVFKQDILEDSKLVHGNVRNDEREFVLYDIGDPDLWYAVYTQLFEKLTAPDGKTLWNDLTKGIIASVGTLSPEWSNQDLNIQYKPLDTLGKEDFSLPLEGFCLVVPLKSGSSNLPEANNDDLIIVPAEDIVTLRNSKEIKQKKDEFNSNGDNRQTHRKIAVRMSRAMTSDALTNLRIISRGSDRYLKLPYTKTHHTQIDVEANADDNELILVGAFGRLTTIVSDTTRSTRSLLTVQAANMGLAGAQFRVLIRECTPPLIEASNEKGQGTISSSILLPPRHTKTFRMGFPLKVAVNSAHCTVAFVNDNDETVAVRDVRIKRDDRCFCVWHCDCVCLSEDPKLLCRELSEAQLVAAGLSAPKKSRRIRSVCYPDVVTLNLFVTFIGVLLALLLLGAIKAVLGLVLRCVGSWGLQQLLQHPRKLERYYECSLRSRQVVYDKEGWPVHPDTKQRTVRLVSKPMEFVLNLIFFITLPCLMICDAMKKIVRRCQAPERKSDVTYRKKKNSNCFSSHNVQCDTPRNRQRPGEVHRWMSPQAEELSTNIWQEGLMPEAKNSSDYQALLQERCIKNNDQSSCIDSEKDDTEFILMQMQKSKESLAKSQKRRETKATTNKR